MTCLFEPGIRREEAHLYSSICSTFAYIHSKFLNGILNGIFEHLQAFSSLYILVIVLHIGDRQDLSQVRLEGELSQADEGSDFK